MEVADGGGRWEVQAEVQDAQAKAAAKRMGEEVQVSTKGFNRGAGPT